MHRPLNTWTWVGLPGMSRQLHPFWPDWLVGFVRHASHQHSVHVLRTHPVTVPQDPLVISLLT